ncbi:MAG: sirohydrochlorin chelatase [Rhodospirillales bacterium]|nr:sirohydrochlorin chelatase [Rhodospirillales bacterium]
MSGKIGVMVCGHGSRSDAAVEQFAALVKQLPPHFADWPVEYGYLEFSNPVIRDGLDRLREQGCDHILAVPGMLFAAMHAKNDIPSVLKAYGDLHGLKIEYGRDLGVDEKMITAAAARVNEAIAAADARSGPVARRETCLVVIGRGSSDPDANSNIATISRLLMERAGLGWNEVGYSGVTFPLVKPCLEHVTKLGYKRIIVFPYFLFTGILIDRIYGFTDMVAAAHPGIDFVKAGYLNDHPAVLATFAERVTEILDGNNAMDCNMCKYREQVLGFEVEVGLPQESHHHHVEGQGASAPGSNVADCRLCDNFCTGACRLEAAHSHGDHGDHHHPVYPQAGHRLGPESVRSLDKR